MTLRPIVVVVLWLVAASQPVVAEPPLSPEEAIKSFHLGDEFTIEIIATEPLVEDPVAVAWDERGRMFVAEMKDYPNHAGKLGRIKVLFDDDGDGRMDRATVFADQLAFPSGVLPFHGGLLVTAAPDILYLKDTDGDDKADVREVVLTGFAQGNQQLRVNSLKLGFDNWIYGANGRSNGTLRFPDQPADKAMPLVNTDFRFRLRLNEKGGSRFTGELEPVSGCSQFGLAFDEFGNRYLSWNTVHIRQVILERRYLERNPHFSVPDPTAHIADKDHGDAGRVYQISKPQVNFHREPAGYFNAASGIEVSRRGWFDRAAFVCEPLRNIVHRDVLTWGGAAFSAERAEGEREREFLASTDPWFRPVNVAFGPDNGLYVVDFYREWVEHPDFVPDEFEKGINFYNGTDRGRIYRVRHKNKHRKLSKVKGFDGKTSAQIVEALKDSNRWRFDTARRLLVERNDRAIVPSLEKLVSGRGDDSGKIAAMTILDDWGSLRDEVLKSVMNGEPGSMAVLPHAVRLAEPRLKKSPELARAVIGLADYPDSKTEFQVTLTLGELRSKEAFAALAKITARNMDDFPYDPWVQPAVLSGLRDTAPDFLAYWLRAMPEDRFLSREPDFLIQVASIAAASRQPDVPKLPLAAVNHDGPASVVVLRSLAVLAGWPELADGNVREDYFKVSRKLLANNSRPAEYRVAAARFLAHSGELSDLQLVTALISPQTPDLLQTAAVESLAKLTSAEVGPMILARWPGATQPVRRLIIQSLFATIAGTDAVLTALEGGKIAPTEMEFLWRHQLLQTADAKLRARAEAIFQKAGADRRAVVEKYSAALTLSANAKRGEQIFTQTCAVCHSVRGTGGAVGPDLSALVSRPNSQLLEDILDPNRQVSADFIAYSLTTKTGEAYLGAVVSETSETITLRQLDARDVTIPRVKIETFQSTGRSVMPEGIEATLTPQDMADLLAFLRG